MNSDSEITKPLSLVQQRARQFEALASLQEVKSKECNWWLSDFKIVKDNPCECEPCENLKSIDEGDVDFQKMVIDDELVDDVEIAEEAQNYEQFLPIVAGQVPLSKDEEMFVEDEDDDLLVTLPVKDSVVEAMNENVNFKGTSSTHHGIKLLHSNDGETQVTDEE